MAPSLPHGASRSSLSFPGLTPSLCTTELIFVVGFIPNQASSMRKNLQAPFGEVSCKLKAL